MTYAKWTVFPILLPVNVSLAFIYPLYVFIPLTLLKQKKVNSVLFIKTCIELNSEVQLILYLSLNLYFTINTLTPVGSVMEL